MLSVASCDTVRQITRITAVWKCCLATTTDTGARSVETPRVLSCTSVSSLALQALGLPNVPPHMLPVALCDTIRQILRITTLRRRCLVTTTDTGARSVEPHYVLPCTTVSSLALQAHNTSKAPRHLFCSLHYQTPDSLARRELHMLLQ
jgi:hypothetical protein